MALTAACDMCQENDHDIAVTIRATGEVTWLCHACYPHAQAAYLNGLGWNVAAPPAKGEAPVQEADEEAERAGKPARRPRVVKTEAAEASGSADPAGVETPAADPDDQRGADRLESGGRAGAHAGPPPPTG